MLIYFSIGSYSQREETSLKDAGAKSVLYTYLNLSGREPNTINLPFQNIFIDSGAFTAYTQNKYISVSAYSFWLQLILPHFPQIKTYANLDDLNNAQISRKNLLYMRSQGLDPMAVYHYGEPVEILDEMCSEREYVGLGGIAVGTISNQKLKVFWEWVYKRYSDNQFHVFGVGTLAPFYKYQPYSIDSTSWIWNIGRNKIAGYKNGLPSTLDLSENNGWQIFATPRELIKINIRAMVDWEKLEWLKNVKEKDLVERPTLF